MTPDKALQLLRQETASGSPVGQALLAYLANVELLNYRRLSNTATDALTLARIAGAAEGVGKVLQTLTPTHDGAAPMTSATTYPR